MSLIKSIPNSITSLNLLSGCFAIIFALSGDFKTALLCIIASAVFDFFDGLAARALKAYSEIGKELDSLADMVSFGVAPAMIMLTYSKILVQTNFVIFDGVGVVSTFTSNLMILLPLLIAVFSALRLAKFNIDTRQSENFIGLATPSCALLCGSLVYATDVYEPLAMFFAVYPYVIPMIALVLSYLLVSEIPMFSFKFKNLSWKDNAARYIFLILVALLGIMVLVMGLNWSIWVVSIFTSYIIVNVIASFFKK